ncbi:hypothetical protein E2C01_014747 [Portunus trituberculatus]|uniref:Uncharacterized protein n=1 Tax=Portunus trituberculatus TaxID=210409 RepID=A0A5B7DJM3_PORTR|nr:hypothetical protein [Portunus trituberculatus]
MTKRDTGTLSWGRLGPDKDGTTSPRSNVLNGGVVNREEPNCGTIFWTHIRDGGTISQGKLLHARTIELYKLPNHTYLSQVLKKCD